MDWNRRLVTALAGLLLLASLAGCASSHGRLRSVGDKDSSASSAKETARRAEAFARFAAGVSHDINNAPEAALAEFERSLALDPDNDTLLHDVAERHLQAGRQEKALDLLRLAAKSPRVSGDTLGLLARTALFTGQTNEAVSAGQAALKKAPLKLDTYQTLAEAYRRLEQGSNSLRVIHQAAAQKGADPFFLVGTAELYANYLRIEPGATNDVRPRIRRLLEEALADGPDNILLLSQAAELYTGIGETGQAIAIYERMVGGMSSLPLLRDAAREKLAGYYLSRGDLEKAEGHLEAIVRENPTRFPQAYFFLGNIALRSGDFDKAAEHLNRFLILNDRFEQAYYDLARAQLALDQPGDALDTLAMARTRFSTTFPGEFLTALAHARNDDPAAAVTSMSAAEIIAKASSPELLSAAFYFQLGALQEQAKAYEDAERSLRRTLEMEPDHAEALNYLGYMWADRGENLEEAHDMIEKALRLEPDSAAYLDSLAWVLFRLGRLEEALAPMKRSIAIHEEEEETPDPILYDHYGDILSGLGRVEEARRAWEKALSLKADEAIQKKLDGLPAAAAQTP